MQRCPACDARLTESVTCPRCGADLNRILRCERLAERWLGVSLQALNAGRADVAVAAIVRSLSFKQTPAAKLVKGFLVEQQYRAFYECLAAQCWQDARGAMNRLRMLLGNNETLRRFDALIGFLSFPVDPNSSDFR